jgi:hypothetical protein
MGALWEFMVGGQVYTCLYMVGGYGGNKVFKIFQKEKARYITCTFGCISSLFKRINKND